MGKFFIDFSYLKLRFIALKRSNIYSAKVMSPSFYLLVEAFGPLLTLISLLNLFDRLITVNSTYVYTLKEHDLTVWGLVAQPSQILCL